MPETLESPAPAAPAASSSREASKPFFSPQPPATGKTTQQAMDEAMLDDMDAPAKPAPAPITAPPKPAIASKPAEAPPKPVEAVKSTETPDDEDEPMPVSGKGLELRNFAARKEAKAKKYKEEATRLKQELEQVRTSTPKDAKDTIALLQENQRLKKEIEDSQGELRLTRYERSTEYKSQFEKPAQDVTARAYQDVEELTVLVPNPDDPDNPTERPATRADFDEIYGLKLGPATKLAKAKFGDAYSIVMQHREAVRAKWQAAYAAVEDHKGKAAEQEQQKHAQTEAEKLARNGQWQQVNESFVTKNPEVFAERDGDEEGNTLLAKATQFVDTAFSPERNNYTPQQQLAMDARVRNWARAFPRLKRDVTKFKGDLDAANKTIEELRGSSPGKPATTGEVEKKAKGTFDMISELPE